MLSTSKLAAKPLALLRAAESRLTPAGAKVVAAELTRLVMIFRISPAQWADMSTHYVEALEHLPRDLLHDAVSQIMRNAKSGDYFPRPGDILGLCRGELEQRRMLLDHARDEAAEWPKWLEDIWGPLPEGRIKRDNARHDR